LTFVLLTAGFLHVNAKGISQDISFSGTEVAIKTVFSAVEKQTGYYFVYNEPVLQHTKPVSIQARQLPFREFLDLLFKDQPVNYIIRSKTILLFRKSSAQPAAEAGNKMLDNAP